MTRELTITYMGEDLEDLKELKEYIPYIRFNALLRSITEKDYHAYEFVKGDLVAAKSIHDKVMELNKDLTEKWYRVFSPIPPKKWNRVGA